MKSSMWRCLGWLAGLAVAAARDHIVLKPVTEDENLPEKALLLMHGGAVENKYYEETGKAVQEALKSTIRLWVILPTSFADLCILSCNPAYCYPLKRAVNTALKKAEDEGWNRGKDGDNLWAAGHSLGGPCLSLLLNGYDEADNHPFKGIIYWASTVGDGGLGYGFQETPIPFMVQNGELDGLNVRPQGTNYPLWTQHLQAVKDTSFDKAFKEKLIVVLPSLNHSNWCPGFDVPMDIMSEVSSTDALAAIGKSTAAFIQMHTSEVSDATREQAELQLMGEYNFTADLMAPYQKALDMEAGENGAPFNVEIQKALSGLSEADKLALTVKDSSIKTTDAEGQALNAGTLKDELTACMPKYDGDTKTAETCSLVLFERRKEEFAARINLVETTDSADLCKKANELSEQLAKSLALNRTLQRYLAKGRKWCPEGDVENSVASDATVTEDTECIRITSPSLLVGKTVSCTLLPPARALSWMMTDSLRPDEYIAPTPWGPIFGSIAVLLCCCCCCVRCCCWHTVQDCGSRLGCGCERKTVGEPVGGEISLVNA